MAGSRQEIHDDVCTHGFGAELGSYGSRWLDRSLLLIPTTASLPMDPHKGHDVCAVEEHLVPDGRDAPRPAEIETGLSHARAAFFLACSFWLADAQVAARTAD